MRYKQPTVRNEASELANRGLDSCGPDENHTAVPAQSYGGLPYVPSHASNERSGVSSIASLAQGQPYNTVMDTSRSPPGSRASKKNTPVDVEELPAQKKPSGAGELAQAKRSTRSLDDTMFPKLTTSLPKDEASSFSEYDSSPRDPVNGFGPPPLTPTDPASSLHAAYPHIVNDSWEYDQSHFEKIAEELAEEDLMRAGKRSGLFDLSRQSSTASSNPFFGNLTPSLISIESCPSDEERTDGNDYYEMAAGGGSDEEEEDAVASQKSPKQLGKHF